MNRREALGWLGFSAAMAGGIFALPSARRKLLDEQPLRRLAFGSCNKVIYAQPLWEQIIQCKPDVWLWLGDSVYANSLNIKRFKWLYAIQRAHPSYRKLRESVPVIGTWDDHDYGANNAGKDYPLKQQTQQAFLDFVDEPPGSARRKQEGIYTSYSYGPKGKRVKVILLDARYHREPHGPTGDLLGEAQWKWLEGEMRDPLANLIVLCSSTVVISDVAVYAESWQKYPTCAGRLWALLVKSQVPVILLSGDLHFAEISKVQHAALRWPLFEVTSSGMTHCSFGYHYKNKYRVGKMYTAQNFGLLEFDWQAASVGVHLHVRDTENVSRIEQQVTFPLRT